ncbi:LPXTG cell wall anchor domain-containing protein [Macrococcus equi]|uniref:LPXTG cell wall anchor domain-containing protein n=1 Tax=Macrococcus equi TaxID=3395462 RepID=UPI0039BE7DD7
MKKLMKLCYIVSALTTLSIILPVNGVQASELSQKLQQDANQIQTDIQNRKQEVKQSIESVRSDIKQDSQNFSRIKEEAATVRNTLEDNHQKIEEHQKALEQRTQELKKDLEQRNNDINININHNVKPDIDEKTRQKLNNIEKKLDNIIKTKDGFLINSNQLDNIKLKDTWLNNKDKQLLDSLSTQLQNQAISHLKYEQKIIEMMNNKLQDYLKLNHNHFNFDDLLKRGFDLSQLSNENNRLIEQLRNLRNHNKLSNKDFNTKILDVLNKDLKEKADKLERINDRLSARNNDLDIGGSFANAFNEDAKTQPVSHTTPASTNKATSPLPDSGERQNKPLYVAGFIILIIGLLILVRARKNKK